jgi:hypothetical protein
MSIMAASVAVSFRLLLLLLLLLLLAAAAAALEVLPAASAAATADVDGVVAASEATEEGAAPSAEGLETLEDLGGGEGCGGIFFCFDSERKALKVQLLGDSQFRAAAATAPVTYCSKLNGGEGDLRTSTVN